MHFDTQYSLEIIQVSVFLLRVCHRVHTWDDTGILAEHDSAGTLNDTV